MNKTFFKIGLGLLALAGLAWPSPGAAAEMKTLHGHVPARTAQLAVIKRLEATNAIHLAVGLPLCNQDAMYARLQQVYDPTSTNYHKFLSPADFTRQFGPTEADYQTVINFARTNGLTVVGGSSNRTLVNVVGDVSTVEKAFHVRLQTYQHPNEARPFYAPDTEPTVDSAVPVLSVYGLNNYVLPKALYHRGNALNHYSTGSSPAGTYWGYDFRHAYAPGVTLTGVGQKVALFECDGYFLSDVTTYLGASGLPSVSLTNVLIDGATGQPSGFGGEVEVALDIDMAISMAPGLDQVIVYETPDDIPAYNLDMLNRIATDDLANQISSSWLIDDTPQFAQIYIQFALQGQSFFQASGDSGAYYNGIFQFEDSPLVTLVGGTTLTSTGSGGVWASEQVWNNGFDTNADHEWAGGGGISLVYSIPSWQTNINMTANKGSTTMRNIPDVALTADNIYIWGDGSPISDVGGTSCAAPLWAGFMALVNQQGATNGQSPLGFINPAIYALAQGTNYTNIFHDIVVGNNTNDVQTNLFFAVPGYDLCTGWGTPNGSNLINVLVGVATNSVPVTFSIPAPQQPWGNTLNNLIGTDPNGLWMLYIRDESSIYGGTNYNGWYVTLTSANPVAGYADNELNLSSTNVSSAVGMRWTTVLSVTNYGPSVSQGITVLDQLPDPTGAPLVSSNTSIVGSSISVAGGTLTWTVGSLATNVGGTLTLTFQGNVPGTYTNGASVTATTTDPNTDNNSAGLLATVSSVIPQPQLVPYLGSTTGGFRLSVTNDANFTVVIQASTNLISWQPIATNVAPFTYTNLDSTNFSQRFYRAVVGQ